jgi:hypothetical protein
MKNRSKPLPEGEGFQPQKPYRSPIKKERYGLGTTIPKGAGGASLSTEPLLADARRGTDGAPDAAPVRLILSHEHSEILAELGESFTIACRGSYPDAGGRYVIHAVPASRELIEEAIEVIRGNRRTIKPRTSKQ